MERDSRQKAALAKRFWQLGYFVEINARLYTPTGIEVTPKQITDIDILGFRMDDLFRPDRIAVDCKTSDMSPINRAIWLHGIMQDKDIRIGFVISKKKVPVDHRHAALGWGVSIVEESEIQFYFELMTGLKECDLRCLESESWTRLYKDIASKKELSKLLDYILFYYWADPAVRSLRYTLIGCREVAKVLKSDQRLHLALTADCTARFAVSLLQVVSEILAVHLIVDDKETLSDIMKVHIYGGREAYMHINQLHRSLQKLVKNQKGQDLFGDNRDNDLTLPEWDMFLSVVRAGLEHPRALALVPRILRFIAIDRILCGSEIPAIEAVSGSTKLAVQIASDIVSYFCRGASLEDGILQAIRAECDVDILSSEELRH
ncbi:MAG: hypothetical protein KAV87_05320 [Desulfobacteraceae bacterium]|nr:hypothetical protein [Desulfobacteraceae bacterium]